MQEDDDGDDDTLHGIGSLFKQLHVERKQRKNKNRVYLGLMI